MRKSRRKNFFLSWGLLCELCVLCGSIVVPAFAQETWTFLPVAPLFQPLYGDLREPHTGLTAYGDKTRFEGAVGSTFEFLQYLPKDGTRWGWGVFGDGTILLDEDGATFPMQAGDWNVGMYVSEVSGDLSHRLEFQHRSAHLGDALQGIRNPIFFSRENFNYALAFRPSPDLTFYSKLGAWWNMAPHGAALFASAGAEVFTGPADLWGTVLRGYTSGDLRWIQEIEVLDQTYQVGLLWKFKEAESRDIRLALVYYNGNSQFGQFLRDHDEHFGFGLFFDP
ncbi:MAG TPA: DUF1207 domain-containing protein [bacterium]|nr:DUF1207 domain-containing protein [bacterium]